MEVKETTFNPGELQGLAKISDESADEHADIDDSSPSIGGGNMKLEMANLVDYQREKEKTDIELKKEQTERTRQAEY